MIIAKLEPSYRVSLVGGAVPVNQGARVSLVWKDRRRLCKAAQPINTSRQQALRELITPCSSM